MLSCAKVQDIVGKKRARMIIVSYCGHQASKAINTTDIKRRSVILTTESGHAYTISISKRFFNLIYKGFILTYEK